MKNNYLLSKEEEKLESQISDTYNWKKDHELKKLEEWCGQHWKHNLYQADKKTLRNLNQLIEKEKSKQRKLKLLRKKIRIKKRWNII
jgi:hypothetical protein